MWKQMSLSWYTEHTQCKYANRICRQCKIQDNECVPFRQAVGIIADPDFSNNASMRSYNHGIRIATNEAAHEEHQKSIASIVTHVNYLHNFISMQNVSIMHLQWEIKMLRCVASLECQKPHVIEEPQKVAPAELPKPHVANSVKVEDVPNPVQTTSHRRGDRGPPPFIPYTGPNFRR
jgi:hypothetical protein